jgi:hypothetical protein
MARSFKRSEGPAWDAKCGFRPLMQSVNRRGMLALTHF